MFQLGLMSSARYWFTDHLLLDGGIFTNIYNNFSSKCFAVARGLYPAPRAHAYP